MNPEKLQLQSADGAQINLDMLYQIAPSCFTEARGADGKVRRVVNFDVLRQLLGDATADTGEEFYQFTWPGKAEARREAARSISKTLRPVPEDSVDWDTTQNLYIEGDNLEVLKLLQKSYMGKVKMIYIDPPYNTGNDFVYNDDFAVTAADHDRAEGNTDELGNRYRKNTESNGRFHSDWCSMIYPRLQLARTLLSDEGVIFISIDDNEVDNLRKICNEIFGADNLISQMIVNRTSEVATDLTVQKHEYCLVYAKNINDVKLCGNTKITISRGTVGNEDQTMPIIEFPAGLRCVNVNDGTYTSAREIPGSRENIELITPMVIKNSILSQPVKLRARWRSSNDMRNFFNNNCQPTVAKINGIIEEIYIEGDRLVPQIKKVVTEKIPTVFSDNKRGSKDLDHLSLNLFDFPKSVSYIAFLTKLFTKDTDIVLDFFSGSATTAQAVFQLNSEDRGHRKFILVQLPETIDKTSPNSIFGKAQHYTNLCKLGEERIRRAGRKIKEEAGLQGQDLDTGFRVFRVDESNMEDVYFQPAALRQQDLTSLFDNVKPDRTHLDLLFGAMLDWGVKLSLPMSKATIDGRDVYTVNEGDLVACFAENITENVIAHIADQSPLRVLFRDSCFNTDADKINIFEQFKQRLNWSDEEAMKNIRVI